jgi:hypothetical protein
VTFAAYFLLSFGVSELLLFLDDESGEPWLVDLGPVIQIKYKVKVNP